MHVCMTSLPLINLFLSPEIARAASLVFARRRSQNVFLPDRTGQPAAAESPQASPPTDP